MLLVELFCEDQTAEHTLQRCPLLQTARTNVWPTAVQLHAKFYGSKEELEKTATVILQTGLSVQRRSRRRRRRRSYVAWVSSVWKNAA